MTFRRLTIFLETLFEDGKRVKNSLYSFVDVSVLFLIIFIKALVFSII
jgi:hypothetical protein